jgi:uncharacterized protein (UPF0216 family)
MHTMKSLVTRRLKLKISIEMQSAETNIKIYKHMFLKFCFEKQRQIRKHVLQCMRYELTEYNKKF